MEWNRPIFLALAIALSVAGAIQAQVAENRYLVYFSDKDGSPYSVGSPEDFLSPKAILRRVNQNIAIDLKDLPINPTYIQEVKDLGEVAVLHQLKWFNAILIETTDVAVLNGLEDLGSFDHLEVSNVLHGSNPTSVSHLQPTLAKDDSEYGPSLQQIDMLNGLSLHQDGYRGDGILIAVLDGGFSQANTAAVLSDLLEQNRIVATRNFVDNNESVYERSNHGSYVLSTMAGHLPDSLIGTAPEANYILCITEDTDHERRVEEAFWVAGAQYVDSIGADIINTSLGYTHFDDSLSSYTYADMDGNTTLITRASDMAASRGILMVTSAGNEGDDDWYYISAPADGDSVLAVGAVNPEKNVTGFSSRGPSFDGRIKPNVMAQGGQTVISNLGTGIQTGNGTSFAGPVMAGMAACLWQSQPTATAWQVHQSIEQSANLFNNPNDSLGFGIPDFEVARMLLQNALGLLSQSPPKEIFFVYPNPYTGADIFLDFPADFEGLVTLCLFDLSGRQIFSSLVQVQDLTTNYDLNNMLRSAEAGMYLLSANCKGRNRIATLIVP